MPKSSPSLTMGDKLTQPSGPKGIKSWPACEQPREKLLAKGVGALSDAEVLAIFIRTGVAGKTALDLAREMLTDVGSLRGLLNLPREEVCRYKGIGQTKYVQFQAGLELGRRYLLEKIDRVDLITSSQLCRDYLMMCLRDKPHESFYALYLDSKHRIIHHHELFRGTIDKASVPIREVVVEALKYNAAAMIVAHNHPSGVAEPSQADKSLTESLSIALQMVGIKLLDHMVVGDSEVISLAEMGVLR